MPRRLRVPDGTDVLRALDRAGVEYLTVRETRAVVVLRAGVLWVEALEGHLQSASTLRLRPVETAAPDDGAALLARFEALVRPDDATPAANGP